MKEVTLTLDYANALLNYLGSKPYAEVAGLIAELQKQVAPQLQEQEQVQEQEQADA